jgi:hypothetical protein
LNSLSRRCSGKNGRTYGVVALVSTSTPIAPIYPAISVFTSTAGRNLNARTRERRTQEPTRGKRMASWLVMDSVGAVALMLRQHPQYTVSDAVKMMLRLVGTWMRSGSRMRPPRTRWGCTAGVAVAHCLLWRRPSARAVIADAMVAMGCAGGKGVKMECKEAQAQCLRTTQPKLLGGCCRNRHGVAVAQQPK